MAFNVGSPFAQLSQQLYDPYMTRSATSSGLGELSRAFNMNALAKAQPLNRGLSQNVNAMRRGQGTYDARRQYLPLQQQLQDSTQNAQFGLGVQSANEMAGLQGLSNLMQQQFGQQRQALQGRNDLFQLLGSFFQ